MIVNFYTRVRSQVVQIGDALFPRMEGWESALRVYGYPPASWAALASGASTLHALVHELDRVDWITEAGKPFHRVCIGDFRDDEG